MILLILIPEPHAWKDWTGDHDTEFGHLKKWSSHRIFKRIGLNLLRDSVPVSIDDATLTEANDAVEGALVTHHLIQIGDHGFQAEDAVRGRRLPFFKLQPTLESALTGNSKLRIIRKKSQKLLWWFFVTLKWSIDKCKVHDLVENLSKMPHLVTHDLSIGVPAMQAQHAQFPTIFQLPL